MNTIPGLTPSGCKTRQQRLRAHLELLDLEAALITDSRYVHYLTGYWGRQLFSPLVLIERDGASLLVLPRPSESEYAADEVVAYESNRIGTLVDDQLGAALETIGPRLAKLDRIGCDGLLRPGMLAKNHVEDLHDVLLNMRRAKDPDELALLRRIIEATEFAYQYALEALEPGVTEVELFAGIQAAAAADIGETLGEIGNDFQIGATGSAPRRREAEEGEVAVLDLTVVVRGYAGDMCRSFVVGQPSQQQRKAHQRIMEVLDHVERTVKSGSSCRELYETARDMLEGFSGWSFPHHLGHGIGLCPHESPRLNPHWDDTFQVGDVFTAEPGLYAPELKAGLRIEQIYHVAPGGLERLTNFPTSLTP